MHRARSCSLVRSVVDLDELRAVHGLRDLVGARAAAAATVVAAVAAPPPAVAAAAAVARVTTAAVAARVAAAAAGVASSAPAATGVAAAAVVLWHAGFVLLFLGLCTINPTRLHTKASNESMATCCC